MTCSEVQEKLSAYYDGELAEPLRSEVAGHLAKCAECRAELEGFRQLSSLSAQLRLPQAPSGMWEELEHQLDAPRSASFGVAYRRTRRFALLAAVLLVAAAAAITLPHLLPGHVHNAQNQSMAAFLQEFSIDPSQAQQSLVERYEGRPINSTNAVAGLGYTSVATRSAPQGYQLRHAYVLKMPCCKCVQTIYTRDSGGAIAVFEHDEDQPDWFGASPAITTKCNGNATTLVETGTGLAATWKSGPRCITVIGASDVNEVAELMAAFEGIVADERGENSPST